MQPTGTHDRGLWVCGSFHVVPQALNKSGHRVFIRLDPYHWFDRWNDALALDKNHELVLLFYSQMRDVVFHVDMEDYRTERERLTKLRTKDGGLSVRVRHAEILRGCRRVIRPVSALLCLGVACMTKALILWSLA
jgi:hypothetical protein